MKARIKTSLSIINCSEANIRLLKLHLLLIFISGIILIPDIQAKSKEVFLKCTGKYEINRGELIKPDWETSYLKIDLNGLKSTIDEEGIKKEGTTLIRSNSYVINYRDNRNRINTIYRVNSTYDTYRVDHMKTNRILIGTCQKSRG